MPAIEQVSGSSSEGGGGAEGLPPAPSVAQQRRKRRALSSGAGTVADSEGQRPYAEDQPAVESDQHRVMNQIPSQTSSNGSVKQQPAAAAAAATPVEAIAGPAAAKKARPKGKGVEVLCGISFSSRVKSAAGGDSVGGPAAAASDASGRFGPEESRRLLLGERSAADPRSSDAKQAGLREPSAGCSSSLAAAAAHGGREGRADSKGEVSIASLLEGMM